MATVVPPPRTLRCTPIAMIHCHCTSALLNHVHAPLLGIAAPSKSETDTLSDAVGGLTQLYRSWIDTEPLIAQMCVHNPVRSAVFLLPGAAPFLDAFRKLSFVQALVSRAVDEAAIFVRCGFEMVEIENVVAPYFIGAGTCPWEELVIIFLVADAVRKAHPSLSIAVHILSCNELEVLPIAIHVGAYFVRSEATLFEGLRPEGRTRNDSNLARFLYLRRVLRQRLLGRDDDLQFPQVWSDVQKKHTVFAQELTDEQVWLHNIGFVKLEGVIVTGPETGSDVPEPRLAAAREAANKAKQFVKKVLPGAKGLNDEELPLLPVVTGSGGNFEMYCRYADYIIVGTALKTNNYWENAVDEANVKAVLDRIRKAQPT
jgi:predicted TIM-barrel enzyme